MTAQQSSLFDYYKLKTVKRKYGRTTHGGTGTKGHRKEQRPFSSKKSIHLVLKSSRAVGRWSFLVPKNKILIEKLIADKAKKFGVGVGEMVNVGNHLHLKLRCSRREGFQKFLKAITCLIAREVTGARRGHRV